MVKAELVLQELDEWMIRWRRFQTYEDFQIEKRSQTRRQNNYTLTGGVLVATTLWTAGPSTIARWFGAPHFFDIGVDAQIKGGLCQFFNNKYRWTPTGYGRIFAIGIPTFLTLAVTEHYNQVRRLNEYTASRSVFGEQARRLVKTGKCEEFLALNIGATMPETEQIVPLAH